MKISCMCTFKFVASISPLQQPNFLAVLVQKSCRDLAPVISERERRKRGDEGKY